MPDIGIKGIDLPVNFFEELLCRFVIFMSAREVFFQRKKLALVFLLILSSGDDMIDRTGLDGIECALRWTEHLRDSLKFISHDHRRSAEPIEFHAIPDGNQNL